MTSGRPVLTLLLLLLRLPAWPAAAAVVTDLGRDDGTLTDTSDGDAADVITPDSDDVPASAADDDADTVGAVTVMLTRESTDTVELVVVAAVVVGRVELNVASSWRALPSSYEHVSRASSTTERLLSGNSDISLFLTKTNTDACTMWPNRFLSILDIWERVLTNICTHRRHVKFGPKN